jgi:hypothetical protein
VAGVPDAELGRTGRGPRTELTHQVPGRRPRPAPTIVPPAGHGEGRSEAVREWLRATVRPALGRGAVGALVLAALAGVVWLGLRWADVDRAAPGTGVSASPAAATSAAPEGPPEVADAPAELADRHGTPRSAADWRRLVEELYARRAQTFAIDAPELLGGVYTPGSPHRATDEAHVTALADAGETVRGFTPTVVEVTGVSVEGDRAVVDLTDRWSAYEVVATDSWNGGPALRTASGRPATAVRMVLLRMPDGWRIDSAERVG